jgi:hypothetical protein
MNIPESNPQNDLLNQLDWLAFQYIAGELDEQQTAQFEQRLTDDLDAQVAVSRQVELTGSIFRLFSESDTGCPVERHELDKQNFPVEHHDHHALDHGDSRVEIPGLGVAAAGPINTSRPVLSSIAFAASVLLALFTIAWIVNSRVDTDGGSVADNDQLLDAWVFTRMNPVEFATSDQPDDQDVFDSAELPTRLEGIDDATDRGDSIDNNTSNETVDLQESWIALALAELDDLPESNQN